MKFRFKSKPYLFLSVALLLLLPLIFLWRVVFNGDILLAADMLFLYEPWRSEVPGAAAVPFWNEMTFDPFRGPYSVGLYIRETWRRGEIPFWYPYAGAGSPILSRAGDQVLYPVNIFLRQVLGLPRAFGWSAILHLWLGSLFTFIYLRILKVGYFGSLVAAITFTYSSILTVWLSLPVMLDAMVWLPLIFLGFELAIIFKDWRWSLLGVLGVSFQILTGNLQLVMYSLTTLGLYAACRVFVLWQGSADGEGGVGGVSPPSPSRQMPGVKLFIEKNWSSVYPLIYAALIIGIGCSLIAFQILPLVELISVTNRADVVPKTYVPIRTFFRVLIPDIIGTNVDGNDISSSEFETYLYIGLLPLFFIAGSLFSKRTAIVARVLFGIGLLFLLVIYNVPPFYQIFYYFYPTFKSLGFQRALYAIIFLWAAAAGIGADYILTQDSKPLLKRLVFGGGLIGLIVVAIALRLAFIVKYQERHFWSIPEPPNVQPNLPYHLSTLLIFFVFFGVVLCLLWFWSNNAISQQGFVAAVLFVLVFDLFITHIDFNPALPKRVLDISPPSLTFLRDLKEKETEPFRISGVGRVLRPDLAGIYQLPAIQVQDSFMLQRFEEYTNLTKMRDTGRSFRQIIFQPHTNALFNALNVKYIYTSRRDLTYGDWFPVLKNMGEPYVVSEQPEAGQIKYWNINNWTQPVLFAPSNSTLSYQAALPYPAVLETAIALDPQVAPQGDTIFEVYASRPGQEPESPLFSYRWEPFGKDSESKWQPVVVDLAEFAGEAIVISLVTTSKDGITVPGGWADPLITNGSKYELLYYGVNSIYKNKQYLPRAWIVHKVTPVSSVDEVKELLSMPGFDPAVEAIIEGELTEPVQDIAAAEKPRFIEYNASHSKIEVEMNASGFLVFSDIYYPGWNVYVDGVQKPLYATNLMMRGVAVPAGTHKVEFIYEPVPFRVGLYISAGTVALIALFLILDWRFRSGGYHAVYRQNRTMVVDEGE